LVLGGGYEFGRFDRYSGSGSFYAPLHEQTEGDMLSMAVGEIIERDGF
jgi:hypothetical protein